MQRIKLSDVKISNMFKISSPNEKKMNRVRNKYLQTGIQDKPIVLDENGYLVDGYVRYLILKDFGTEYINCIHRNSYKRTPTYYIYGLHKNCDKEFVWRVPHTKVNDFIGKVIPGDTILVGTKNGTKSITVTKIELLDKQPIDQRIKKVIKVI